MRWAWLLALAAAQEVKRPIVTTDLIHGVLTHVEKGSFNGPRDGGASV